MNADCKEAALEYGELGWRVFPIRQLGKTPAWGDNWKEIATCDAKQIERWWSSNPQHNVAVMMGAGSRLIDVEFDGADEELELRRIFGGGVPLCPTFRSSRGCHHLFAWDERFAQAKSAPAVGVRHPVKFRLHDCYSVFPPSQHESGTFYRWEPGLSVGDVALPSLPEDVVAQILSAGSGGGSKRSYEALLRGGEEIPEGRRHETMASFIGRLMSSLIAITDDEVKLCFSVAMAMNAVRMGGEGLEESAVRRLVSDMAERETLAREGSAFADSDFAQSAFKRDLEARERIQDEFDRENGKAGRIGIFGPDSVIKTIKGDPAMIRIESEFFMNAEGVLEMPLSDFLAPGKAVSAIAQASLKAISPRDKKNWYLIARDAIESCEQEDKDDPYLDRRRACLIECLEWLLSASAVVDIYSPGVSQERIKEVRLPKGVPCVRRSDRLILFRKSDLIDEMSRRSARWTRNETSAAIGRMPTSEVRVTQGSKSAKMWGIDREKSLEMLNQVTE